MATNPYYKLALQQLISQHTAELKDYTVILSGQATNVTHCIYQIELFAQGHKYRAIVIVNRDTKEVYEKSWNEVMEIDLKHINYMQVFVEEYYKLSAAELKTNDDFVMVDRYIRNQNSVLLKDATVLGAANKPQNLGFNFKVFYIVVGKIYSVEVYIESFSGKINQLVFSNLDFSSNFVAIRAEGGEVEKIVQAITKKANIDLTAKKYFIDSISAKDFMFGSLYTLTINIEGITYNGLLYHDHSTEEVSLFSWNKAHNAQSCQTWQVQDELCLICSEGYILNEADKLCYR